METKFSNLRQKILCFTFYPTYKEWKQRKRVIIWDFLGAFYPTYKEWKLCDILAIWSRIITFYPTYKEWKQNPRKSHIRDEKNFLSYL